MNAAEMSTSDGLGGEPGQRFALVVIVQAKDSEAAWQMVADGLHAEAEDSPVEYVGAPWEGIPTDGADFITDGISIGQAGSRSTTELIPCD